MEALRGTYDLYDKEILIHMEIVNTLKEIAQTYNFDEIKTPLIEKTELFSRTTGNSSDIVRKEMYSFLDKGDRNISLRPELTAGVVRSFLSNKIYGKRQSQYKFFYYGEAFRYERPQKGRYRQFHQFGVEMFGDETVYSDVEVILMASSIIKKLGLENKVKLKINTIGSAAERRLYSDILRNHFKNYKDDMCDDCKSRLEINPLRILDCKIDNNKEYIKDAPQLKNNLNTSSLKRYAEVLVLLDDLGIEYEEDTTLVRGLDYYNDIVFEFVYDNTHTLIGGGRYDTLVDEIGNINMPAIGFGIGIERIVEAFKEQHKEYVSTIEKTIDVMYVGLTEKAYPIILKSMNKLREEGVICSCLYNKSGLKGNLKEALRLNSIYLVIIGEDEIEKGEVTVKNLITQEEQALKLANFEEDILNIKD